MGLWGHDKICALGDSALFKFNDKKDKKNKLEIPTDNFVFRMSRNLFFLSFLSLTLKSADAQKRKFCRNLVAR